MERAHKGRVPFNQIIIIIKGPIKRDIKRQTWAGTHVGAPNRPQMGPIYLATVCAKGRKCTVQRAGTKATTHNWDKWTGCLAPSSFLLSPLLFGNWDWFAPLKFPIANCSCFGDAYVSNLLCCLLSLPSYDSDKHCSLLTVFLKLPFYFIVLFVLIILDGFVAMWDCFSACSARSLLKYQMKQQPGARLYFLKALYTHTKIALTSSKGQRLV